MDDLVEPVRLRYIPDRRYTALAILGACLAVLACVLSGDRPGRLLGALAAVVLGAYAVGDLVFSPRLEADRAGLTIRSPFTRARLGWSDVEAIRADSRSRLGLRSTTLEIDAGPVFAVLSRRALGAEPADVAALLSAFRAT